MNLTAPQKNALHGLDMLLRLSEVRVTRATLRNKLWQHPDFPSLNSLSDTLDEFKVNNIAAHLSPEQLPEIPLPALTYLHSEGGFFAPVRTTDAHAVEWYHTKRGWQKNSLAEFSQIWNGVTLLIEPTERSGEVNYAQSRRKELVRSLRLPFTVFSLIACLTIWAGSHEQGALYYTLLLIKLAGLVASGLLVWYSLDATNPFLRSICQLNSRTNCRTVLNTSAAKIFSWLSWAEVGLFYFGGGLLSLLFFRSNTAALYPWLFGMTIVTLPYTFWSIYYQWHRARQWCILCLTVQSILWLEFGALYYFQRHLPWISSFSIVEMGLLFTAFVLLPTIWALLKPIVRNALMINDLQLGIQKIKFDPLYLESLSQRIRMIPPIFTGMRVPTLGDANALNTIIIVTNPTCSLCARVHLEIEELMSELENVRCQFIIAVERKPNDAGIVVARSVLSQSNEKMLVALHQWYKAPQLHTWQEAAKNTIIVNEGMEQVGLHQRWCELAGINSTPAILLDGIEVPRYYAITEFKRLVKFFKEKNEVTK